MFGLAVCSVQFPVHPVPPGHIVEIHTRIKDALMFGDKPCSSHIQTGNRHFTRLLTLIRDLQKFGDCMDFDSSSLVSRLAHWFDLLS